MIELIPNAYPLNVLLIGKFHSTTIHRNLVMFVFPNRIDLISVPVKATPAT